MSIKYLIFLFVLPGICFTLPVKNKSNAQIKINQLLAEKSKQKKYAENPSLEKMREMQQRRKIYKQHALQSQQAFTHFQH